MKLRPDHIPLLTPFGTVLLAMGGVFLLLPIFSSIPFQIGAIGAGGVVTIFVAFLVLEFLHIRRLHRSLTLEMIGPARVCFGQPSDRRIALQGAFPRRRTALEIRLEPLERMTLEPAEFHENALAEEQVRMLSFSLTALQRGEFQWRYAWYRATLSFGVCTFQSRLTLSGRNTIEVVPNQDMLGDPQSFAPRRDVSIGTHRHLLGSAGREFDSLRRYQPGDDPRSIDWKRSAQGRGVLVKGYRPETNQRVTVALECGRRMSSRLDTVTQLDVAVNAVARLTRTVVGEGDEIGLFAFSNEVHASLKVAKGKRQEEAITRSLTLLSPQIVESDYALLLRWISQQSRRSLLVILTGVSYAETLRSVVDEVIGVRNKHLILIVALADREILALAETPARSLEDAYVVAAAEEQLSETKRQMEIARRRGVECIYADASDLGDRLQDAYLRCKRSGRL